MQIEKDMQDQLILAEMGERLAKQRIAQGFTQSDLAKRAGIGKRTLERMEAGMSVQATSLIRSLRALSLLTNLDMLLPEEKPRPMDLLKLQGKSRKRASKSQSLPEDNAKWSWGDE